MGEGDKVKVPRCKKCGSRQIRTTFKHKICIRCGFKEERE